MKNIEILLSQTVTRRQFLIYVGTALLGLIGVSGFLQRLSSFSKSNKAQDSGFGAGSYGGKENV